MKAHIFGIFSIYMLYREVCSEKAVQFQVGPTFEIFPVLEGINVELQCDVETNDPVHIFKDVIGGVDINIVSDSSLTEYENSSKYIYNIGTSSGTYHTLIIQNISIRDEGIYLCKQRQSDFKGLELNVLYMHTKPVCLHSSEYSYLGDNDNKHGAPLNFTCVLNDIGDPPSTLFFKNTPNDSSAVIHSTKIQKHGTTLAAQVSFIPDDSMMNTSVMCFARQEFPPSVKSPPFVSFCTFQQTASKVLEIIITPPSAELFAPDTINYQCSSNVGKGTLFKWSVPNDLPAEVKYYVNDTLLTMFVKKTNDQHDISIGIECIGTFNNQEGRSRAYLHVNSGSNRRGSLTFGLIAAISGGAVGIFIMILVSYKCGCKSYLQLIMNTKRHPHGDIERVRKRSPGWNGVTKLVPTFEEECLSGTSSNTTYKVEDSSKRSIAFIVRPERCSLQMTVERETLDDNDENKKDSDHENHLYQELKKESKDDEPVYIALEG
ncbi:uncharacterized protein [Apostichopus japonicus]|uniref:uncharacterized protein n=1 Tax=Stichopus japonicus TaxID=307972 RepID=UPI003AB6B453